MGHDAVMKALSDLNLRSMNDGVRVTAGLIHIHSLTVASLSLGSIEIR